MALTSVYHQCIANFYGRYTRIKVMKMSMGLTLTLMYYQCPWWLHWQKYAPWVWLLHQCFTNVTPMKLVLTLECELWQGQLSWLLHRCVANVPLVQLGPSPCITNTVGSYTGHVTNSPFWPCFWPSSFFFCSKFT